MKKTKNGAITHKSSGNPLIDLFSMGGSYRNQSEQNVIKLFSAAFSSEPLTAFKILIFLRDCRGGMGERDFFHTCLRWLATNHPPVVIKNLNHFITYGRWDDYFCLIGTPLESDVMQLISGQFFRDIKATKNKVSLLGKWMPSINTSSKETRDLAEKFRKHFKCTHKKYRQSLVALRKKIGVLEREMCSKKWGKINYEEIPSKAGLLYTKAFHRNDGERYREWQKGVIQGKKQIKTAVLNPYDIVSRMTTGDHARIKEGGNFHCTLKKLDKTTIDDLDMYWNNLPDYIKDSNKNILCVCDTSGSMRGRPIVGAMSLSIYAAERNNGIFKNSFVTFSNTPAVQTIEGKTIFDKVRNLVAANWGQSTNIQAVFDLILSRAVECKVAPEGMPSDIIIISDMEFDKATETNQSTNFQEISNQYEAAGYKRPNLTFWNVNAKDGSPVRFNQAGVKLVSGYSASIFSILLEDGINSPIDMVFKAINNERYNVIDL